MQANQPTKIDPWLLVLASGAIFMAYLGNATLGVLQPSIQSDLGLDHTQTVWIVNAFMVTLAMFTAPAGRLGDDYGHRTVILVGLGVLGGAALFTAFADGFLWLVIGLGAQGIGASALYPTAMAIASNSVAKDRVGAAIGSVAMIALFVFVLGPSIAGFVTDAISWRAMFWLTAILAAFVATVGFLRVPKQTQEHESLDVPGTVSLIVGIACVVTAILQSLVWGWAAPATLVLLGVGIVVLVVFVVTELKRRSPLLDIRLLTQKNFGGITWTVFVAQLLIGGYLIYFASFLQDALGFSAFMAGLGMLVAYAPVPFLSRFVSDWTGKVGPQAPTAIGMALLVLGPLLVVIFGDSQSFPLLIPSLVAMGVGQGFALPALVVASMTALEPSERGAGGGLITALRWIAVALGTAGVGVVINNTRINNEKFESVHDAALSGYIRGFVMLTVIAVIGLVLGVTLVRNKNAPQL